MQETRDTPRFRVGDRVRKPKGYEFDSVVVAVFTTTKGDVRLVCEEDRGILHIFNEAQVEHDVRDTPSVNPEH